MNASLTLVVLVLLGAAVWIWERWQRRKEMSQALRLIYSKKELDEAQKEIERFKNFSAQAYKEAKDAKDSYDATYRPKRGSGPNDGEGSGPSPNP